MLTALILAVMVTASPPDCGVDRSALLALDQDAFDQDPKGGWRAVASQPGCKLVAADLLRDYRIAHPQTERPTILYWHEGQLRAMAGDAHSAVPLFERARMETDAFGWNAYVDATIAFLQGDRARLEAARESLAAIPLPPNWEKLVADQAKLGRRIAWPPNLEVVDGLIACFGRSYEEAYGSRCRPANGVSRGSSDGA